MGLGDHRPDRDPAAPDAVPPSSPRADAPGVTRRDATRTRPRGIRVSAAVAFRGRLVRRERHGGTQVNGDEDEMASARYPLRKVQFGMEPAAGSLVAATTQLVAEIGRAHV